MKEKMSKFKWHDNFVAHLIFTVLIIFAGEILAGFAAGIPLGIYMLSHGLLDGISNGENPLEVSANIMALFSPFMETFMMYITTLGTWIAVLLVLLIKRNRPIYRTLSHKKVKGNNIRLLLTGILIGFGMNGLCILVAALHGDIQLSFRGENILAGLAIFIAVFIQSSSEEILCRGYLYQKLIHRYHKPVIAIVGNSLLFAFLHIFNNGVTVLALLNITLSGLLFSLIVYYFDSLWCAFAAHAAWNYTQNILFGLPNSGIRVPFSFFTLNEAAAKDSFAYNVDFGVEGTVLAVIVLAVACVAVYLIGTKKNMQPTNIWADYDAAKAAEVEVVEEVEEKN